MEKYHHLNCEAPICNGDPDPIYRYRVLWYPGELICKRKPYEKFQIKQLEINRLVKKNKFKNMDSCYTADELENSSI